MKTIQIFVCYSRKDEMWLKENSDYALIPWLNEQLKMDDNAVKVTLWYDIELKKRPFLVYEKKIKKEIDKR